MPATSRGASCVPHRAPGCCHGCRSGRRRANLPCKVPAVGASLCSCWTRKMLVKLEPENEQYLQRITVKVDTKKDVEMTVLYFKIVRSKFRIFCRYTCICMCTFRSTAASYLRSLSRAEMVVRRRPLSLLDSAAAIWYSSFSMEKGLAIRRHFRSCAQNQNRLQIMITFD